MPTKEQLTPPLTRTVERGDRFVRRDKPNTIYVVVGKVYHDDLSLSYRLQDERRPTAQVLVVSEKAIKKHPWVLAWRARRTAHVKEKVYRGVFYGTA